MYALYGKFFKQFIAYCLRRKDPFTYATSSEQWGSGNQYGKYAVKVYTIDGVMIYQVDIGGDNTGKIPLGGIIYQSSPAESMMATIANPITYYAGSNAVINQDGHSRDLYNYYWTSYSRGTDGALSNAQWHNVYLDGYIPLRVKSIYDPCPYLYRIPSNGTYNQFGHNPGWTSGSYLGGVSWNVATLGESWFLGLGSREAGSSVFVHTGGYGFYYSSTAGGQTTGYVLQFSSGRSIWPYRSDYRSWGFSVRCIEPTGRYAHTFLSKKVCKNSQHFFLRSALESMLDYKVLALARVICYRLFWASLNDYFGSWCLGTKQPRLSVSFRASAKNLFSLTVSPPC